MYFCIRRCTQADTLVLEDIRVIRSGHDPVPTGFVPISQTVSGKDANLNKGSGGSTLLLCVKRTPLQQAQQAVTDIAIIRPSKKEAPPPGYVKLERNLNEGCISGDATFLCYRAVPIVLSSATAPSQQAAQPVSFEDYVRLGQQSATGTDRVGERNAIFCPLPLPLCSFQFDMPFPFVL